MSLINVNQLTFSYEGSYDNIFENVSFQIDTDWKLGFIGRNGRGKTTFLKLLCGEYSCGGAISASVSFDYFPFPIEDKTANALDVAEQICPNLEFWMLCRELSLLEADGDILYRPYETLSNGEQTKLLLAALFLKENNFLLIDEPTNHLDIHAREIVADYLHRKKGFILVSHDRRFLDRCVDHILSIGKTNIEVIQGNFSSWQRSKELRDQFELAENEKLEKDIDRFSQAKRRAAKWSDTIEKTKNGTRNSGLRPDRGHIGRQSAKMMKRSKNAENRADKALEEKSKLLQNIDTADKLKIQPARHHSQTLAELSGVSTYYNDQLVCSDIGFSVAFGDRIALLGRNGCGKSTILKLIAGQDISYSGRLFTPSGLTISYVSQDTSFLKGELSQFATEKNIDESLFKAILRKLDFSRVQFEKRMEDFSGGQKKKVLIATSLCEKCHLYLWDEPLNYIDVLSRIQIENLLLEYEPTMIFVEHDRAFVDAVASEKFLFPV